MQERTVEEELYERLKLGYDLLCEDDWRLKDCFLYFAAFAEDFKIHFEDLLWHWIGEGLIPAHDGDDPEADAFSLLNKLLERTFIESCGQYGSDVGYFFKVHDVMRDLAFYILEKDCGTPPAKQLYFYRAGQNLKKVPKECTAISEALKLSLGMNELETLPDSLYAPKLVSLLLGGNPIQFVPRSFLINFPKLRILDLRHGRFDNLPEALGDLRNLVCLDLSHCKLKKLPATVGNLHLLKCLKLSWSSMLNYLPSGVACLTALQVLHTRGCGNLTWAERTPPRMARAEFLGRACPTFPVSLEKVCGLVVLTQLSISGGNPMLEVPHSISTLTKLKVLHLELYGVNTLPAGMPYWCNQLQKLHLWDFKSLKCLPSSFTCHGAFPALVKFQLCRCSLAEFPEVHEGALPKLQTLDFTACPYLTTLPLSLQLLSSLRKLILLDCDPTLKNSCRKNCENSSIWGRFDIKYYRTTSELEKRFIFK